MHHAGPLSYDGFLSYSHAADDLLAPRLQAGLQRFAKPWWKRRAIRVFRDESSLSANPHLWSSITDALDDSGWFVLLLSPDAAASEWVNQEIAYWVANCEAARILPVVTGGEFGWLDGDVAGSAVPAALQGVFEAEPRWVDLRFARGDEALDLSNPSFSAAVADIASAIRGVPKDELESEEVRQFRRTRRTAWAAVVVLLALAVTAGWAGVLSSRNAREAERQAGLAQEQAVVAQEQTVVAQQQTAIAEEQVTVAEEAAARADRTAKRLLDLVVRRQPANWTEGVVEVPSEYVPVSSLPPTFLPELVEEPVGTRLDFRQEICEREACFGFPLFVDPDRAIRTRHEQGRGALWLAYEPFYIRHGFEDMPAGKLDEWLAAGYSVRLFVTKIAGPDSDDRARLYSAGATMSGPDASCGPSLDFFGDHNTCVSWVFEFPEGFQPGVYDLVVEWVAPCADWFETAVCPEPSRTIGLAVAGGTVGFLSEEYLTNNPVYWRNVNWPFDPWADAGPLPGDG